MFKVWKIYGLSAPYSATASLTFFSSNAERGECDALDANLCMVNYNFKLKAI